MVQIVESKRRSVGGVGVVGAVLSVDRSNPEMVGIESVVQHC
jgi:hypothetical protein